MSKSPDAFRTISEVADWLGVQAHVLRFWESKFSQVKPVKRAGGRRYYRPSDMKLLGGIKKLLHDDGLTIKGVQKLLQEHGVNHVAALSQDLDVSASPEVAPGGTVVKFQEKAPRRPEAAQIDMDLGEPAESQPLPNTSDLPSFLSKPAPLVPDEPDLAETIEVVETPATQAAEASATTEAHQPAAAGSDHSEKPAEVAEAYEETRRPLIAQVDDVPLDDDIQAVAGLLSALAPVVALTAAQRNEIKPVVSELRDWLNRFENQLAG